MKWGVRKAETTKDIVVRTKTGSELTLNTKPSSLMIRLIDRANPNRNKGDFERRNIHMKDKDGQRVGEMYLYSKSPEELHVSWIGVKDKHRGHGYASAAMNVAVDIARTKGYKKLSLQAITKSEDAVHIYKKMGFKEVQSDEEPWEGLTDMELEL
jgi:ribosomal protein S18 acetylase RimI-like enzyme